ncbi:MAG: hypothetical protein GX078_08780 [Clostridiales bacterium]|nr:hypothetical protein [Clostridiales bacterium]
MNWNPLLAILAIVYAVLVVFIAAKKPKSMWEMGKIKWFRKVMGEKGTVIFFYIWAVLFVVLGLWLFITSPIG